MMPVKFHDQVVSMGKHAKDRKSGKTPRVTAGMPRVVMKNWQGGFTGLIMPHIFYRDR